MVLAGDIWTAPVAHAGFLWMVSRQGQLIRVAPYCRKFEVLSVLGDGFGCTPVTFGELRVADRPHPALIAVSPSEVVGLDLLTLEARDLYTPPAGQQVCADLSRDAAGVDISQYTVTFLVRTGDDVAMVCWSNATGTTQTFSLGAPVTYAGPFRVGSRLVAYTQDRLFVMSNGALIEQRLPEGITALVNADGTRTLRTPPGHLPYVALGDEAYIVAERDGAPLLLALSDRERIVVGELPDTKTGVYCGTPSGLVFAAPGRLTLYRNGGTVPPRLDAQMRGTRCGLADGQVAAGFVHRPPAREAVRLYAGNQWNDYGVEQLDGFAHAVGFYQLGPAVALAYLDDTNRMHVTSWEF